MNINTYDDLQTYNKILVYGAGIVGSHFLGQLSFRSIDKTKVIVWDRQYEHIREVHGFQVTKPTFYKPKNTDETVVVFALQTGVNLLLIEELKQKFIDAGFKHFALAEDIMGIDRHIEKVQISTFVNNAYSDFHCEEDADFSASSPLVKPIAFYLPQFHEIPENNEWWGKGFTEWTNTKQAEPNFKGHYQPRKPHSSIGYYNLSDVETIRKQAELAKRHGIFGWCIYYYWFSGTKLLTKPLDLLLEHKDIDINFCLLWCNETWSKRWVGDDSQVLMDNSYTDDDPVKFFDDISIYMEDSRYIKIDGKPVVMVYHAHTIPNVRRVIEKWRERALERGIGEITVLSAMRPCTIKGLGLDDCFDGETEFCSTYYATKGVQLNDENGVAVSNSMYYYDSFMERYKQVIEEGDHSAYLSCICGYDNTPRYGKRASVYDLGFSLKSFFNMVRYITDDAVKYNKEFIFIFAWNEWAESAYLEPDERFGFAMLNTFSKAICGLPFEFQHVTERKFLK